MSAGVGKAVCHYKPKQPVFSQGERADTVFYIQTGTVQLSVLSTQGKEATLALLGPGDFLGEGCLATDQPIRLTTATAIANSSILRIEKKRMLKALHEQHELSDLFVAYVVGRHNRTQAELGRSVIQLQRKTSGSRLAHSGSLRKRRTPRDHRPSRQSGNPGRMVGTTRSRVNFFINKFRKLGFIHYNGGLKVHNSLLTVVLHE